MIVLNLIGETSTAQDFCESYRKSNRQMIIYSDVKSFSDVFLIIDTNYWLIRINDTDLEFESEDRIPLNSSHSLNKRYSFAIKAKGVLSGNETLTSNDIIVQAFYNVLISY